MQHNFIARFFGITMLAALVFLPPLVALGQVNLDDASSARSAITAKQDQIEALEAQIEEFRRQINAKRGEAQSIGGAIGQLEQKIRKANAQIAALRVAIEENRLQVRVKEQTVDATKKEINERKALLAVQLRRIDALDRERPFAVLLFLSQPYAESLSLLEDMLRLSEKTEHSVRVLYDLNAELGDQIATLESQSEEQAKLVALASIQRQTIARQQEEKEQLYRAVKQEEHQLREKAALTEAVLTKLRKDLFALLQTGVSVEDAIQIAENAAQLVGIRPEFLLALLEIESRIGLNLGTGNWREDMSPRQHDAFVQLTETLGLNPDELPVSAKPSYGWGGAMGPAQFIPTTWLAYSERVASVTGIAVPSPWDPRAAFVASALYLKDQGATNVGTREEILESERRAAYGYVSGSASCTRPICRQYYRQIADKAEDIASRLYE